jgi:Uma2 family endonuclease
MMMATTPITDQPRLTTEVAELWPPQGQWTETEYFQLPDTNRIMELSEGELILMPPPSDRHQRVLGYLYRHLFAFVSERELGTVRFAPLAVRLWPGKIREPDLLFMAAEHADRIGELVYGPPDLIMEVLSPGTRKTDRREKFHEYAQAGVAEYWLVDPEAEMVEVFTLEDDVYRLTAQGKPGEQVASSLLAGFVVTVTAVFDS